MMSLMASVKLENISTARTPDIVFIVRYRDVVARELGLFQNFRFRDNELTIRTMPQVNTPRSVVAVCWCCLVRVFSREIIENLERALALLSSTIKSKVQ